MKKVITLTESQLTELIQNIIEEQKLNEDFFGSVKDKWRGLKGLNRGYGMVYFENMSKLERLIRKLIRLDEPNQQVMNELLDLKQKVSGLNIPQNRKDAITTLIDNSTYHFNKYSDINQDIVNTISTLKIDSWK